MVRCDISIENKRNFSFSHENVVSLFNSIKYSRATYYMTRSLGTYWMKKLFWPTFKSLSNNHSPQYIDINLPYPFNSILQENFQGDFCTNLSVVTRDEFQSTAKGTLESENTNVSAEILLQNIKKVSASIKTSLGLIRNYNVNVTEISINVNESDTRNLYIQVEGSIPQSIVND